MFKGKVIYCKDKSFKNQSTGEQVAYFDIGIMVDDLVGFVGSKKPVPVGSELSLVLGTTKEHKFYVSAADYVR